jgi:hypothetical protein
VEEPSELADPQVVAREVGEELAAALDESDAPGELIHDAAEDASAELGLGLGGGATRGGAAGRSLLRSRWRIGVGGVALLLLAAALGTHRRRRRGGGGRR